jgi:PAP2 superfamily
MESGRTRDWIPSEAQRDLTETTPAPRSHWLRELIIVLAFYYSYELIRRFAHLGNVQPRAFRNQIYLTDLERFLHIYTESAVQKAFLGARWFIKVMNVYYGTLHFIITAGLLVWVYLRRHEHYRQYRNLLGMTTALALIGYFAFPLAPPRMTPCHDCFVDTLDTIGGLWSYHSSAAKAIANPFAAMPSLHFGWALWCGTLLWSFARNPFVRALSVIYPAMTLLAIVVTANHYWLDAVGGAIIFFTASYTLRFLRNRSLRKAQALREEVSRVETG